MQYKKIPLKLDDQVSLLQSRGLKFSDLNQVKHYLSSIGYYRLSAYWLPFETPVAEDTRRNHQFLPNTTFDQILSIYIFDRRLRLLVMEAIERIEIFLRASWAQALSEEEGSHAHLKSSNFKCAWNHAQGIYYMGENLRKSSEKFVQHYLKKYSEPHLPPIWAVVETLSMGGLSRWISATKATSIKKNIATRIGLPTADILESVLHALTPVRNVCAHHCRLWNRKFTMQLPYIKKLKSVMQIETVDGQNQPSRQLYNYLVILIQAMDNVNNGSSWKHRLKSHILTATPEQQSTMGFPQDWVNQTIFQ